MAINTTPSVTLPRCTFVGGRGRRCDLPREPLDHRHAFNLWHLHGGPDPDLCYSPPNQNERNDMAKQQIVTEKTAPEETEVDRIDEMQKAVEAKYEKYPSDPAKWTAEHDLKLFGDVARLMAKAPYAAHCRMFPYLQGLISPNHEAERARQDLEYRKAKDVVAHAFPVPPGAYADGPVVVRNGLIGVEERRY